MGAFAELVSVSAGSVYPLPGKVDFVAGACLPMNYLTMTFALLTRGALRAGETVLVHGAAGGIGTAAIQLAKALDARVIAVTSSEAKADFVMTVGADDAVLADGFKHSVAKLTGGRGVDMVVDPVGGDRFTDSLRCLAPLGRLLVIGFTAGEIPTVKVNRLLLNNIDVRGRRARCVRRSPARVPSGRVGQARAVPGKRRGGAAGQRRFPAGTRRGGNCPARGAARAWQGRTRSVGGGPWGVRSFLEGREPRYVGR